MSAYHPTFASHAHVDNELCDRYVAALRARGIDVWYDRNNAQSGHFLGDQIEQELTARSAFVLLMTEAALRSFWVRLELQTYFGLVASNETRVLLPVRIGPCTVPPMLNSLLWIDAQAMPFEQAIDAIATALAAQSSPYAQQRVVSPSPPHDAAMKAQAVIARAHSSPPPLPSPQLDTLPPLGPAPAPINSISADHLTPTRLDELGFRGYSIGGVECILPPICPVAAGIFIMGSDKSKDPDARDDEMPQHQVDVGAFAISRYHVTVAEYDCAVRVGAVREPPRSWGSSWRKQLANPDHPVVCVSWNDAVAYGSFLANLTNQWWRLPTEAQWEKAARGTDGRIYPWGKKFGKMLRSIGDIGSGRATSVGIYSNSESPYHVQGMVGSILQWTSTVYMTYPYQQGDGREHLDPAENRVLRGGPWHSLVSIAVGSRAACRSNDQPNLFDVCIGFRLALGIAKS